MKKLFVFVTLLIIQIPVFAQSRSYFYNENGQFLLDTTLTISKEQLRKWLRAENNIVAGLSNIEYPPIFLDNKIQPPEYPIIVSFELDTADIKNIKIISDSSNYDHAVTNSLQKQGSDIAYRLNRWDSSKTEKISETYYLAIKFEMINFYEKLRQNHAVPVIRSSRPLIDVLSEPLIGVPLQEK